MSTYQIKLTPVNAFFFGGEKHSRSKKNTNGFEMDYFVNSEMYPQQTTLLGVLRYYLLMKNGLLNPQKNGKSKDANTYIGEKSFEFEENGSPEAQTFGKITSLSPLYFLKDDKKHIVAPYDYEFKLKKEYENYILEGYDPKIGYKTSLTNLDDGSLVKFFKDHNDENDTNFVFIPYETVGNKKGDKGKSEDDGFYKQTMYKLNDGWSFAYEVEIDLKLEKEKQFVNVGAEKQTFLFEISPIDKLTKIAFAKVEKILPAIICISDCFVSENIWENVSFSMNESVSFRNLQSANTSKNYSSFSKGYSRGKRYNLLKRGSILYFETVEQLEKTKEFFVNKNAEKIGFNRIQTIQNQKK